RLRRHVGRGRTPPLRCAVRRLSGRRTGARLHRRSEPRRPARDRGALPGSGAPRALATAQQQRRGAAGRACPGRCRMIERDEAEHRAKMARIKAAKDRLYASKTGEKGLLMVHTGTGKGKSTAAWGLAM